jgi:glycerophosphoryl diester phosphodiesterase
MPHLEMLWLVSLQRTTDGTSHPTAAEMIEIVKRADFSGVNVGKDESIDAAMVKKIHAANLKFFVWTVDDAPTARRLQKLGVDGITTNRPAWLRAQLNV